jgi:DNA excision repair protein ERCC-2
VSFTVAVRALCEFTARQGDLDLRFTPSPSSQEGIEGHRFVTSRRGGAYQAEVSLSGEFGALRVRGRADGYDPDRRRVEEIKTFRGDIGRQPANHRHLHWAQARVYGWLLCRQFELPSIEVALVYFDVGTHAETVFAEHATADELRLHFELQCGRFLAWAGQEGGHRAARDTRLGSLAFPHAGFRTGQRELAESVYKAAKSGRCLMAQAPTGIGKTVGTLFPLLKACPTQGIDKVFYLAAKTSGRRMALDALGLITRGIVEGPATAAPVRVLELVARDKVCEFPDKACHGDDCPLARGFYDRLPQARLAAAGAEGPWDQPTVRALALAHGICPYYFGQELARWCDVAVGDYNHYFDLNAMLHGLAQANQWRVGVLVDEAHNLVERARRMYTAELDQSSLARVRRTAPAPLKKPLDRLHRCWSTMTRHVLGTQGTVAYQAEAEVPEAFQSALQRCLAALSDHFAEAPVQADPDLQGFYFDALRFSRLVDLFGDHSLFDLGLAAIPAAGTRSKTPPSVACVRNVLPAPFLRPRLAAARTVTLFSATLRPWDFYADTLGLPEDTAFVDVASPFRSEQLSVRVARHISTRYRDRQASLPAIVELMARQWHERPGNYLAFFSSHEYLGQVARAFAAGHPGIDLWLQSPRMEEGEQARFIERFTEAGRGIGFAVLGGSFSEGIDLPGDRLIGAFIATLGLPQVNAVNEQLKQRMGRVLAGRGDAYTYLYPGLQKVVQAAGRVIRTPADRGVIHLMDDRFQRPEVRRLLPQWWALP